jgi:hypothetical protein
MPAPSTASGQNATPSQSADKKPEEAPASAGDEAGAKQKLPTPRKKVGTGTQLARPATKLVASPKSKAATKAAPAAAKDAEPAKAAPEETTPAEKEDEVAARAEKPPQQEKRAQRPEEKGAPAQGRDSIAALWDQPVRSDASPSKKTGTLWERPSRAEGAGADTADSVWDRGTRTGVPGGDSSDSVWERPSRSSEATSGSAEALWDRGTRGSEKTSGRAEALWDRGTRSSERTSGGAESVWERPATPPVEGEESGKSDVFGRSPSEPEEDKIAALWAKATSRSSEEEEPAERPEEPDMASSPGTRTGPGVSEEEASAEGSSPADFFVARRPLYQGSDDDVFTSFKPAHLEELRAEFRAEADRARAAAADDDRGLLVDEEQAAEAARLFEEGLSLMRKGRKEAALERWEEAVRLAPDNRTYQLNLKRLTKLIASSKDEGLW